MKSKHEKREAPARKPLYPAKACRPSTLILRDRKRNYNKMLQDFIAAVIVLLLPLVLGGLI